MKTIDIDILRLIFCDHLVVNRCKYKIDTWTPFSKTRMLEDLIDSAPDLADGQLTKFAELLNEF